MSPSIMFVASSDRLRDVIPSWCTMYNSSSARKPWRRKKKPTPAEIDGIKFRALSEREQLAVINLIIDLLSIPFSTGGLIFRWWDTLKSRDHKITDFNGMRVNGTNMNTRIEILSGLNQPRNILACGTTNNWHVDWNAKETLLFTICKISNVGPFILKLSTFGQSCWWLGSNLPNESSIYIYTYAYYIYISTYVSISYLLYDQWSMINVFLRCGCPIDSLR